MQPYVLPLEAALSIRKLQTVDVWTAQLEVPANTSSIIVPPIWLDEDQVSAIRKSLRPREVVFSYFLEDVRAENLQKFLQHISHGDHLLILIDQLPKPQQIEILKRIWQADLKQHLKVILKDSREWPFEEGLKSLPWFLRDRMLSFNPELFFLNELITFEPKMEEQAVSAPSIGLATQWFVYLERLKEELSFRFWCSPHWTFQILRHLRAVVLFVFSYLWYVKVPLEYGYWFLIGRFQVLEQFFWKLRALYGGIKRRIWYIKVPFEFIFWQVRNFFGFVRSHFWIWKKPVYWLHKHLWKIKKPLYWLRSRLWLLLKPFYFISRHFWKIKKPYHFVRRYTWVLKKPYYFVRGYIWLLKEPYHFARRYTWMLKVPYYFVLRVLKAPYHFVRRYAWMLKEPYHFVRRHIWMLKEPYHFIRNYIWMWKVPYYTISYYTFFPYHFLRLHSWKVKAYLQSILLSLYWRLHSACSSVFALRWKLRILYWNARHVSLQIYFLMTYPLRKVFWFCSYQYRKRVLGEANS